jgi:hypothetical protein
MSNPGQLSNQEYKDSLNQRYGQPDLDTSRMNQQTKDFYDKNPSFKQSGKQIVSTGDSRLASKVVPAVTDTKVGRIPMNTPGGSGRAGGSMGGHVGGMKPGQSPWLDNPIQNEDELAEMLRHAGINEEVSPAQQAQQAGSAIKQFTPQLMKGVANDVRKFKGQDPTKDPEYAKLSPQQQQQYIQAQQTINSANADELEKFDANQAASNIQGMAKSVVNPANTPDVTLKSNVVDRKTAADYAPATVGGKPAALPTTPQTPPTTPQTTTPTTPQTAPTPTAPATTPISTSPQSMSEADYELAEMLRHAGVVTKEGSNQGGVWSASPPKAGQPSIKAPSGDPEGAPSTPKTASPGWGKDYKPLIPDTTKGSTMGVNKGGTWQADPKGTIKAPGGDPESVKEDDADPFNDPFFTSKSKPEAETFTQLQQQNAQGKGTSLKTMNPIDRDQYLKNTGRTWDEKTQRSVPAVKTTTTPITTNEADPHWDDNYKPRIGPQQGGIDSQGHVQSPKIFPDVRGSYKGSGRTNDVKFNEPTGKTFMGIPYYTNKTPAKVDVSSTQATPLSGTQSNTPGALRVGTSDRPPTVTPAGSTPKLPANYEQPAVMRTPGATVPSTSKPKITVKPGESMKDAIQRTQTEKEFGDFLKGQSGQQFGTKTNDTKVFNPATDPLGNASAIDESLDSLRDVLRNAGMAVNEGVLTDSTGSTLDHIIDTYKRDVKDFEQTGEMSRHLEQVLYDYYFDDMPYVAKTGEDIDTSEWIGDRFAEDLGMNENLITPMIEPVAECNYTMEGDYCPAHGLAECGGSMYEDGLGEELSRLKELATGQISNINGAETSPVQAPTDIKSTDLDPAPFVVDVSGIGNLTHDDSDPPVRVDVRGFGPGPEDLPAGNKLVKPMQPLVREVDEGNNDPMMSRLKTLAGFMVK